MTRGTPPALPPSLIAADLRQLAAEGIVRTFRSRTVVISEGDESDSFYIIISGRVKIFVSDARGKEIVLETQGPGDYFGEMVLDDEPRSASAMTLEPSRIATLPRARLVEFLASHPDFASDFIQKLIHRIRSLTKNVKGLALLDVAGRVAHLLMQLAAASEDGRTLERLTQQEIADRVGASREMISRVMKDLTQGGYLVADKKQITVVKPLPRQT
jgi:CRP/FNR family transcriptional regulator, cyclic AMP receptor protein